MLSDIEVETAQKSIQALNNHTVESGHEREHPKES